MQEWNTAAKVGLCMVLVAAIAGIAFAVFHISTTYEQTGQQQYNRTLTQISKKQWDQYRDGEFLGSDVKAFIDTIKDKDMICVVRTRGFQVIDPQFCPTWGLKAVEEKHYTGSDGYDYGYVITVPDTTVDAPWNGCMLKYKDNVNAYIMNIDYDNRRDDKTICNDKKSPAYIDDTANFKCRVIYDQARHEVGVYFNEEGGPSGLYW